MKTTIFPSSNTAFYSIIVFFSFLLTSCGSYQNSSYFDSDGIYGNTDVRNTEKIAQNNSSNYYKEYFNSLQNENQPTEIFTDVNKYSDYNTSNDTLQRRNQDYADWGNNSNKTTVNVYTNPWNMSLGFGWGFPSYGWGYDYSWNYPFYGWGYSSFGWNYPYYGWGYPYSYGYYNYPFYNYGHYYTKNYSYNSSRRGSSNSIYSNRSINSRYSQNNAISNRRFSDGRYDNNNNSTVTSRRNDFQNQNNNTRSYSSEGRTYRNDNDNNTRSYTPRSNNSESYTPSRSYSPSSNSSSRSSGSFGNGGRPSGSSGRR